MRILRTLLTLSSPEFRRPWALVFVLMVFAAIIEMVFAALFFAFAGALAGQPDVGVLQSVISGADRPSVLTLALMLGTCVVLRTFVGLTLGYLQASVAARDGASLARRLLERYLIAPFGQVRARTTSELIRNIYNSVEAVFNGGVLPIATIASEILVTLGIVAVLAIAAPAATASAALIAAVLAVIVVRVMHPVQFKLGMRSQQLAAKQFGELAQVFSGLREAKVFGVERYFVDRFRALRQEISANIARVGFLNGLPRVVVENAFLLATVFIATGLLLTGGVDARLLAVFGLFAYAGLRIMPSAARIITSFNVMRLTEPAMMEVAGDFRAFPAPQPNVPAVHAGEAWKELRVEQVRFRYPDRLDYAVRDVSITLRRGQAVGITGRSGSGKSTLVDLIIGLVRPESGRIVNEKGAPLHQDGDVMPGLGYVPQLPILIHASVRQNIAFGVDDPLIDDARVIEVAKLAQIHDFILGLEHQYDTDLGELGSRLSGGQRQRIAIARALYRRPQLLVFDEATSALDLGTEGAIIKVLAGLRGSVTTIVIAHRLNTIKQCDTVFLMDRGTVIAEGPFEQLSTEWPAFQELVRLHELD